MPRESCRGLIVLSSRDHSLPKPKPPRATATQAADAGPRRRLRPTARPGPSTTRVRVWFFLLPECVLFGRTKGGEPFVQRRNFSRENHFLGRERLKRGKNRTPESEGFSPDSRGEWPEAVSATRGDWESWRQARGASADVKGATDYESAARDVSKAPKLGANACATRQARRRGTGSQLGTAGQTMTLRRQCRTQRGAARAELRARPQGRTARSPPRNPELS